MNSARDFIENNLIPWLESEERNYVIGFIQDRRHLWDEPKQAKLERANKKKFCENKADWSTFTTGASVVADVTKSESVQLPAGDLFVCADAPYEVYNDAINQLIDYLKAREI